jgi:hypothetical protein
VYQNKVPKKICGATREEITGDCVMNFMIGTPHEISFE